MTIKAQSENSYLQMFKNVFAPLTGANQLTWYRFNDGIYLADQTKEGIGGIKKEEEVVGILSNAIEYITLNNRRVIFNPQLFFLKNAISEVSLLDTKIATLFQIKIMGLDKKNNQVWLVDTTKEIRMPGEIIYWAKQKNSR